MGLLNTALGIIGLRSGAGGEAINTKANSLQSGNSFDEILSGDLGKGPSFAVYRSMRAQLNTYEDWVYAAASRVAEECSTIDIKIYMNRTKQKSATLGRKLVYAPRTTKHLFKQLTFDTVHTAKGVQIKANVPALEEVENHPLIDILDKPNKFMSGVELYELTFLHLELTGNAFWAILRGKNKQPAELWPLMPNLVHIAADDNDYITGYTYNVNGQQIPFEVNDIIHHKYSNPTDLRWGMSTVLAATRAIDTDRQAAEYNRKFFYNSAQPDAVLYTDKVIDDKTWQRIKSQFQNMYGGTANAHKTAILENNLQYKPMNPTQKEMDFLKSREFNRDMILTMFGVPASVLGMDKSMSRANAETAEYVFTKGTIRPKMLRLVTGIQEKLANQFDERLVVSFTDPVPENKEHDLNERDKMVDKVMTRNEARAQMGLDPVKGGDELYVARGVVPLGTDLVNVNQPTESKPNETDEDKPADEGEDSNGSGGSSGSSDSSSNGDDSNNGGNEGGEKTATITINISNAADLKAILSALENSKKKDSPTTISKAAADAYETDRNKLADEYEPVFYNKLAKVMRKQLKEVLTNVDKRFKALSSAGTGRVIKSNLDDLFDEEASAEEWQGALGATMEIIIGEMGTIALEQLMEELGIELPPYDVTAPDVKEFYEDRIRRVSVYFDVQTQDQLRATLREGIDDGESVDQLKKRVKTVYDTAQQGKLMDYRLRRIARTEPIFATTWATIDGWQKSGVVDGKVWMTAKDEMACIFCRKMNKKALAALNEAWYTLGDSMDAEDDQGNTQTMKFKYVDVIGPPLHPNCRCTLLPVIKDAE